MSQLHSLGAPSLLQIMRYQFWPYFFSIFNYALVKKKLAFWFNLIIIIYLIRFFFPTCYTLDCEEPISPIL